MNNSRLFLWMVILTGLLCTGCAASETVTLTPAETAVFSEEIETAVPTPPPFIPFSELRQHQLSHGVIDRADISPQAGLIATAFRDGGLGLYTLETFAEVDFISLDEQVAAVVFSPDGSRLAVGLNGEIRVWAVENGRLTPNPVIFSDMGSWVEAIAFSPDGSLFAAGGYPKIIRIWQTADNSLVHEIDNGQWSKSIAFSPDGQTLAAGDTDGIIQLWDVENGRLQQTIGQSPEMLSTHDWGITALSSAPDGRQLAATDIDNFSTIIWDISTAMPLQTIQEDTNFVKAYRFSTDSRTLLTIRGDAKLWDTLSGELLQTLENPGTILAAGDYITPHTIVTINVQGLIREWENDDGKGTSS